MSLVAQCLRGSGPVPRSKSRFRLKARENESSELRAAHIASVHASAGPSTPPGKQREERRAEWKTQPRQVRTPALYAPALFVSPTCLCPRNVCRPVKMLIVYWLQVIKGPGGAVLRGCKKTKRKLKAHFQLRAEIHSQLRVIASLFVLRIFLTCLVGYPSPGFRSAPTPPAVQTPCAPDAAPLPPLPMRAPAQPGSMDMDWEPEPDPDPEPEPEPEPEPAPAPPTLRPPSARLAARHPPPEAPTGPPMPLDSEDPVMLQQLQVFCLYFANSTFLTPYNQLQRRLGRARQNKHFILKPAFDDPSNQELLAKLQQLGSTQLTGDHNTISHHSMQLAVAMQQHSSNPGKWWWPQAGNRGAGPSSIRQGKGGGSGKGGTGRAGAGEADAIDPTPYLRLLQAPRSSQAATQAAASEPGPSTPLAAKRSKRTKAEPEAAEPTKGKGKAAKAKPAPQPGRWLDRDCNAALNMQRIGESRWRPLELCWWPQQAALPAKGKEYPGLGYKRLRDKPAEAQQQHTTFLTPYNQLQRRLGRARQNKHFILKPAFDDPSNQELLAKLQQLGSTKLTRDHNTITHHSMQLAVAMQQHYSNPGKWWWARLGWSGEEAQLFIKLACGYSLNTDSPELQAATLDKGHVNDLIKEAAKQRRLLALEEGDSLQDTVPLSCRMRHAVHQLGLTRETEKVFTAEPARSNHWDRWFSTGKLANQGFEFERTVETDGVSVCVHYTRPLPTPPAPPSAAGPSSSNSSPAAAPGAAAVAAHELGLPRIGKGLAEQREFVFNPATQTGVGIDPGVTQAVSAASGVWDPRTGKLLADQLRRWKLTKGQVKHGSGLNNARRDTERWLAPIKPHLQHLAAASSAGTSLEATLKHITVTLATWDAVWEVYLDPKWAQQRLRLYGAQDRTLEQFFKKARLEEDMEEVSMQRHGRAKQLVVFFGAATIGTRGGWGADAVLRSCRKVVCRPRGTDQRRGRVVLVDEHRTTRVSSAVNGQQPCERQLNKRRNTRPADWKPPAGQVEPRLLRPAWSQQRDQPVRGMMWCPVVAPHKAPQAPRSSQAATPAAASEPGPSTPLPAKRSKRTKAEPAAEPTKGKGKGKAAKAKPAPQPGRWLDRDCNAALNMQRIGESKLRPHWSCASGRSRGSITLLMAAVLAETSSEAQKLLEEGRHITLLCHALVPCNTSQHSRWLCGEQYAACKPIRALKKVKTMVVEYSRLRVGIHNKQRKLACLSVLPQRPQPQRPQAGLVLACPHPSLSAASCSPRCLGLPACRPSGLTAVQQPPLTQGGDQCRTSRVISAVNSPQPYERRLNSSKPNRPAGWKPQAGEG
ncbi:hypothetical protein QJQ45_018072, partial [Haematococcus lacustris]